MVLTLSLKMKKIENINRYVHYYFLAVISSLLIWGFLEYLIICNGGACLIDTSRLWKGLLIIVILLQVVSLIMLPYIRAYCIEGVKSLNQPWYMVTDSDKKLTLVIKLLIGFICISIFTIGIYYMGLHKYAHTESSIAATQANMFVVAATLFAPIAALILVQDWKVQHNKNISSEIARKIWKNLDHVKATIGEINYTFENLENLTDDEFSNLNIYLKKNLKTINNLMLEAYLDIRLLDEVLVERNIIQYFKDHIFKELQIKKDNEISTHKELMSLYETHFLPTEKNIKKELKIIIKA